MQHKLFVPLLSVLLICIGTKVYGQEGSEADTKVVKAIFDEALNAGESYRLLDELCNRIGPRLSGSAGAAKAVEWGKRVMEGYGFDRVYLQEVMVPHWERGAKEQARIVAVKGTGPNLAILAIGGSVATAKEGLTAEVIEVQSLDEVKELGRDKIQGKIVFYNRPFDQSIVQTGAGYGGAVDQRTSGASRAAEFGAVGVVVRSVSSAFDDAPHTGALRYQDGIARIPAAALGFLSADRLSEALKKDPKTKLYLHLSCQWFPDAKSFNVIGEMRGSEKPNEILVVGGHLDSWDVGQGAHDDGAGCVHAIGTLLTLKKLGIRPKHTIRVVLFMNEENGIAGGRKYAEAAKANPDETHVIALESDAGGFSPRGFGVSGPDEVLEQFRSWLPLFPRDTISYISKGGGGADIGPLREAVGTATIGFIPDSQRVFDLHHSPNDTFQNVNRRELELGTASIATLIYLIDQHGLAVKTAQ